ncbi:Rrf2 family transcriptional regulator [Paenibacillus sp. SYP-B3998]|uniref:Rrf2 family transcriptional regulator n=1 Tax=Paenibacillus sp. SYP-B3998 TaxID=2678564 RepID=A0A6G4A4Q2_9BACL|nr:Rrf2 family transcriptional regulator [Paenibacillus sp. SYP-B3998]NEW09268.1 Rrf2 family transcriptional regulator [Paenibacillus sp. SYP-B3998]
MKYTKATNYALHTMVYLAAAPVEKAVGVRTMAELQGLSPTFLSKILTKLVKAGLIESSPGVNGGYKLSRSKEDISFLDIINAIEGSGSLFMCSLEHQDCLIQGVMVDAEQAMEKYLMGRTIAELADQLNRQASIRKEALKNDF